MSFAASVVLEVWRYREIENGDPGYPAKGVLWRSGCPAAGAEGLYEQGNFDSACTCDRLQYALLCQTAAASPGNGWLRSV